MYDVSLVKDIGHIPEAIGVPTSLQYSIPKHYKISKVYIAKKEKSQRKSNKSDAPKRTKATTLKWLYQRSP